MIGFIVNATLHLIVTWVNFWCDGRDTDFEFLPIKYYVAGLLIDLPVLYMIFLF